jgi:two-component system KDP operon response regulator KdpE
MRPLQPRILAVSDQPSLWDDVRPAWEQQGLLVSEVRDRRAAVQSVRREPPGLVLLDLDLPNGHGLALLERLRAQSDAGIIAVARRSDEQDKVRALELGADDYLAKPFSPGELMARINTVLRRVAAGPARGTGLVTVDERLQIDCNEQQVIVAGQRVALSPTEYRLLYHLVQHAGRTLSFENILTRVWGPEYRGASHYVHLYVTYLRHKLEADPSQPRYILSKRGVGYTFRGLP